MLEIPFLIFLSLTWGKFSGKAVFAYDYLFVSSSPSPIGGMGWERERERER